MKELVLTTSSAVVMFYAPSRLALLALFLLLIVDTYWGIKAVRYHNKQITSNRFNNLFAKVTGYFVFVAFGLIIREEFNVMYAVWIACALPIYSELKSINENQKACDKAGIFKRVEDVYNFAKDIKNKQDKLRK